MRDQDQQTRVLYDLCTMIIQIFRSPPLSISFPSLSLVLPAPTPLYSCSRPLAPQVSSAAFGALFLGISFALMLFGTVTFMIGFVLMPLVITLVFLFYFVGMLLNFSEFGRAILWPASVAVKFAPEPAVFDDER
ncbi:unnamed protein product [Fraxinus pennsylvanica]|uniref:Transmembrane protein n=1 Tax=Fraxinus pennsylvanica TaxID=56036 RepID=A0AAD2A321_9LAMI|nr:unnamed protein product [Fraxinus pennsylvanica]